MRTDFLEIGHSDDPEKPWYISTGLWIFLWGCNKTLLKCCTYKIRHQGTFYIPFGFCHVNGEHLTPQNRHPSLFSVKIPLPHSDSKIVFINVFSISVFAIGIFLKHYYFHSKSKLSNFIHVWIFLSPWSWHWWTYHENANFGPLGRKRDMG